MAVSSKSVVYKTVGDLEIKLDIYMSKEPQGSPVLLYFHGNGSPLAGSRLDIAPHMFGGVGTWKYTLISADYRLAPQVGIQEILDDVRDCIAFIRDPNGLAAHVPRDNFDVNRLAVSGSGGGGYLALLAGLNIEPKVQAVLCLYPITDPLGPFFTTSHRWEDADHGGMDIQAAGAALKPLLQADGEVVANSTDSKRAMLYKYTLHCGNLARLLRLDFTKCAQLDGSNYPWRIPRNRGLKELPPTFVVHGVEDDRVGIRQSDELVNAMRRSFGQVNFHFGDLVKYERLAGRGHAFDEIDDGEETYEDEFEMYPFDEAFWENQYMDTMYNFMHCFV